MNKNEFLQELAIDLVGLPQEDGERWLEYYAEMLNDRIEDGMSEESAVADLGDPKEIVRQILSQTPFVRLIKNKLKPNHKLRVWEIILIALGSPIWLALVVSAAAIFFSVFVSLWAGIVSLWATELALCVSGVGCFLLFGLQICLGYPVRSLMFLGTCFIALGLSYFGWYLCKYLTVFLWKLCKVFVLFVKSLFVEKEGK